MKILGLFAWGTFLFLMDPNLFGQAAGTNGAAISQWDFNQGDLRATAGKPLEFLGSTADNTTFEQLSINGTMAGVMRFPAAAPGEGFLLRHGAEPNGGGTNVNQYTLIMDLMWPSESDQAWRALFQTDTNNTDDAEMFLNPDNALGVENQYHFELPPNIWHRVALVFDLTNRVLVKYVNGTNSATQELGATALDSRFSLGPALLLFTDNDGETRPGYVNSIQFRAEAMTAEQIEQLGGPSAAGIPGLPMTAEVRIESIRREGNNVIITVSGGGALQLQKKVKLNDAAWQNLETSSNGTFTVPIAEASSFFRALRL